MRQVKSFWNLTIWSRILRGYAWFAIAALGVYWFIRPFTPFWLDITFIFIFILFVVVAFALTNSKEDIDKNKIHDHDKMGSNDLKGPN